MRHTPFAALGLALAACSEGGPDAAAPRAAPPAAPAWSIDTGGDLNAFFECLEAEKITLIDAHRGGPQAGLPENALETFAATLKIAPALLEIDIAASKDGVLFLHHDDTLERTTTGSGEPGALAWSAIERLRLLDETGAETDFAPTRLDEALEWADGRTILALDIKRATRYEAVADDVRRLGAETRVLLIAYSVGQAEKLHRLLPEAMISLNLASQSDLNRAVAAGVPADRIVAFTGLETPDPRLFDLFNERDVEVIFGTLGGAGSIDSQLTRSGDDALYMELAEAGVDMIATDRPAAAQRALDAAGRGAKDGVCGVSRN